MATLALGWFPVPRLPIQSSAVEDALGASEEMGVALRGAYLLMSVRKPLLVSLALNVWTSWRATNVDIALQATQGRDSGDTNSMTPLFCNR